MIATRNKGKAAELSRLLAGAATRFESLRDHSSLSLPEEGEASYRENALGKARAVYEALGVPALGDDSGLEVDALKGAPGIRSARYAGALTDDRLHNERLLDALWGVPWERRTARFRCLLALVRSRGDGTGAGSAGDEIVVEGVCEGRIGMAPRGDGGFGYDPIFEPVGSSRTFAELPAATKDALSHRGRAAAALKAMLAATP